MSKFMRAFFVLALALVVAVPVFAETQNVKVSGSLDAYYLYRDKYDLAATHNVSTQNYFMSQTQVEIAADLTDNVSTVINLGNERDWNGAGTVATDTGATPGDTRDQFNVFVDLAYVQMKEIFYSPLTITIGRQDLWWGRGFVLGNNSTAWDHGQQISADEYSIQTAFDAVRATLDFNPWTIDAIYSKISENNIAREDERDLYGVNIGYKFAEYNAVAEGYFLSDWDRTLVGAVPGEVSTNTNTLGGRVQFDPISQITLGAEAGYQFGAYENKTAAMPDKRDRKAWALDLFGTYRFDLTWKPDLTIEYVYFSGQRNANDPTHKEYNGWNRLYRGRFYTAIEDFRGWVYPSSGAGASTVTDASQNSEMIQLKANLKPLDDLLLTGSYSYFWSPQKDYTVGTAAGSQLSNSIGNEFDVQVTYDYTEDVTFGLLTGWFISGNKFNTTGWGNKTATDIVASTKVTF